MANLIGSLTGLMFVSIPIVWIVMHYHYRDKRNRGFTADESRQLQALLRSADAMAERIKALESILDVEAPDWRDQHDAKN